jgi:hypothetical protein
MQTARWKSEEQDRMKSLVEQWQKRNNFLFFETENHPTGGHLDTPEIMMD